MWCFPLSCLYFVKQRGSVACANTQITVFGPELFLYVLRAVRGWQPLQVETNTTEHIFFDVHSEWLEWTCALLITVYSPTPPASSHPCRIYAFNIPQITNVHLFKVFNAVTVCSVVDFFFPLKIKILAVKPDNFRVILYVCVRPS